MISFVFKKNKTYSIIRTFFYNFKLLPIEQAIHFPLLIGKHTIIRIVGRGGVKIRTNKHLSIEIGVSYEPAVSTCKDYTNFLLEGQLVFDGTAKIGKGTKVYIQKNGYLFIGDDFKFTGKSSIRILNRMTIGQGCLFSWDLLFMDYDGHTRRNKSNEIDNYAKEIIVGNNVWIGCDCKIMGGADIPDGSIIGCGSFIGKKLETPKSIYINNGVVINTSVSWEIKATPFEK